jgi:NAD(P)H-flavin reductase
MNKIVAKRIVSENLVKFEIKTSREINEIKPGQYVILRIEESGPRIPVTVSKVNAERETITVFALVTDNGTEQLAGMYEGTSLFSIVGPFGIPVATGNFGTVLCVGRGLGIVAMLPVLSSLRTSGNRVIAVLSAQTKEGILLENEIRAISDEVLVLTEDGSYGEKGSICHAARALQAEITINQVFAFGSAKLIKETNSLTRKYNVPMQAVLFSGKNDEGGLNSIFRVSICSDGKSLCVDGVSFNAYFNGYEELIQRFGGNSGRKNAFIEVLHEAN